MATKQDTRIFKSEHPYSGFWYWHCPACGNCGEYVKTYQEAHASGSRHENQECRER